MRTVTAALCAMLVAACSGGGGTGGTGGGSAGGGTGGSTGGGTGGSGGGSTIACPGQPCLSGTVTVPAGQTVNGVEVQACLPNAAGDACDPSSPVVTVSGTGTSAPWAIGPLNGSRYFVISAKDNNGNNTLDTGDLLGGHVDAQGQFIPVVPPLAGLAITLVVVPPQQSTLPTELVGNWTSISSTTSEAYTFNADATYTRAFRYEANSCQIIKKVEITATGRAATSGTQLTLSPNGGSYQATDCSNIVTSSPPSTQPVSFLWSVGFDTPSGKTRLTLKDPAGVASDTVLDKQ